MLSSITKCYIKYLIKMIESPPSWHVWKSVVIVHQLWLNRPKWQHMFVPHLLLQHIPCYHLQESWIQATDGCRTFLRGGHEGNQSSMLHKDQSAQLYWTHSGVWSDLGICRCTWINWLMLTLCKLSAIRITSLASAVGASQAAVIFWVTFLLEWRSDGPDVPGLAISSRGMRQMGQGNFDLTPRVNAMTHLWLD